ncbi:MAG: hypothetical protein JKP98_11540 [Rhodobacteraceae bacterium]|nr:hypothetical protein [Paracoccaceae bacterium]
MQAKAAGADIRMVYSPLDALELARRNPGREVVFFGLGFETTTPSTAWRSSRRRARGWRISASFATISRSRADPRAARRSAYGARRVHRAGPCVDGDRHPCL